MTVLYPGFRDIKGGTFFRVGTSFKRISPHLLLPFAFCFLLILFRLFFLCALLLRFEGHHAGNSLPPRVFAPFFALAERCSGVMALRFFVARSARILRLLSCSSVIRLKGEHRLPMRGRAVYRSDAVGGGCLPSSRPSSPVTPHRIAEVREG